MKLGQILESLKLQGSNSGADKVASTVTEPVTKTAAELGAEEADNMVKIAEHLGALIGQSAAEAFHASLYKTAALEIMLADAFEKVAENVAGQQAAKEMAGAQAEQLQVGEMACHHATVAAQAAVDAIQSATGGDEHTATQMMNTAASSISMAQNLAARVEHPAVHNHVAECAQVVAQAANMAGAQG